jgi:Replication-relaxation
MPLAPSPDPSPAPLPGGPPTPGDYDLAVIQFLAEVRLATGHQLARRLWASAAPTDPQARAARRCLARLEGARVIQRLARRMGGVRGGSTSIVFALGSAGRRLLIREGFEPRRLTDVGERYVAHALAVTEFVVRLSEADRSGDMEVIEVQGEPGCWRGFLAGIATRLVLKPDLFLRIGAGALEDRWFVEVDLGSESAAAIARKAARYVHYLAEGSEQARHGVFPRVVFTAPNQRRLVQLRAALGRVREAPPGLFTVWDFEETVGRLASEASA